MPCKRLSYICSNYSSMSIFCWKIWMDCWSMLPWSYLGLVLFCHSQCWRISAASISIFLVAAPCSGLHRRLCHQTLCSYSPQHVKFMSNLVWTAITRLFRNWFGSDKIIAIISSWITCSATHQQYSRPKPSAKWQQFELQCHVGLDCALSSGFFCSSRSSLMTHLTTCNSSDILVLCLATQSSSVVIALVEDSARVRPDTNWIGADQTGTHFV